MDPVPGFNLTAWYPAVTIGHGQVIMDLRCTFARLFLLGLTALGQEAGAAQLLAGAAKVDIGNPAVKANDPLYAKALVLRTGATTVAIVTVDAVALEEIGPIRKPYLSEVRSQLRKELNIDPAHVVINASHCHGSVAPDVAQRTVQAVKDAFRRMVPVRTATGTGHEDRIMENRRLRLKNGREADVRRAYSLPPDEEVVGAGPVDPEIGILRLDRENGQTLAVVYNFAVHPIQGVPSGGNTADITGFASRAIEDSLGHGAIALFLQGCAGDVNPIRYKDTSRPPDAEPLGNMLGLSTVKAMRAMPGGESGNLTLIHETMELPRADLAPHIASLEAEEQKLLRSFRPTSLNVKAFVDLLARYRLFSDFPSYDSHLYLHEQAGARPDLSRLDAENRKAVAEYLRNVYTMERLTRLQTNLALLRKHQAANRAAGRKAIDVEVTGLRIGRFVLVTFPGELTVQTGLDIKRMSPHKPTFVAGVTNGYIYYAPTPEQLKNVGGAQEDSDCLLAPEWHALYKKKVEEILRRL
jgi:hypothetical protein